MPDPVDLSGEIASVVASSRERNRPIAFAYVRTDGTPAISYRGGVYVYAPDVVALWVRNQDTGLAAAIEQQPHIAMIYWTPEQEGTRLLQMEGRARRAPEVNDEVWNNIIESERAQDPDRKGTAILIDVDLVKAFNSETGLTVQARPAVP